MNERSLQLAMFEVVCRVIESFATRGHNYRINIGRPLWYGAEEHWIVRDKILMQLRINVNVRQFIWAKYFSQFMWLVTKICWIATYTTSNNREQVGKFLHILALLANNSTIAFFYDRSHETIYFINCYISFC